MFCVYALNRNKRDKLYIPSMFQTSGRAPNPKNRNLILIFISLNHPGVTIFSDYVYTCYRT